jgi:hypothetical protein
MCRLPLQQCLHGLKLPRQHCKLVLPTIAQHSQNSGSKPCSILLTS